MIKRFLWYLVFGIWYWVFGIWYLVFGIVLLYWYLYRPDPCLHSLLLLATLLVLYSTAYYMLLNPISRSIPSDLSRCNASSLLS